MKVPEMYLAEQFQDDPDHVAILSGLVAFLHRDPEDRPDDGPSIIDRPYPLSDSPDVVLPRYGDGVEIEAYLEMVPGVTEVPDPPRTRLWRDRRPGWEGIKRQQGGGGHQSGNRSKQDLSDSGEAGG
jgi:hypothetical protein